MISPVSPARRSLDALSAGGTPSCSPSACVKRRCARRRERQAGSDALDPKLAFFAPAQRDCLRVVHRLRRANAVARNQQLAIGPTRVIRQRLIDLMIFRNRSALVVAMLLFCRGDRLGGSNGQGRSRSARTRHRRRRDGCRKADIARCLFASFTSSPVSTDAPPRHGRRILCDVIRLLRRRHHATAAGLARNCLALPYPLLGPENFQRPIHP